MELSFSNENLLKFLNGEIDANPTDSNDDVESVAEYTEGEVHEVVMNRYERNAIVGHVKFVTLPKGVAVLSVVSILRRLMVK